MGWVFRDFRNYPPNRHSGAGSGGHPIRHSKPRKAAFRRFLPPAPFPTHHCTHHLACAGRPGNLSISQQDRRRGARIFPSILIRRQRPGPSIYQPPGPRIGALVDVDQPRARVAGPKSGFAWPMIPHVARARAPRSRRLRLCRGTRSTRPPPAAAPLAWDQRIRMCRITGGGWQHASDGIDP